MSIANENKKAASNTAAPSKPDINKDQTSGTKKGTKERDEMKKDRTSTSNMPTGKTVKNSGTKNK